MEEYYCEEGGRDVLGGGLKALLEKILNIFSNMEKKKPSDCKICSIPCEERAIKCDLCKWWIHAECEKMTVFSLNFFTKYDDYVWFCKSCRLDFRKKNNGDDPIQTNAETMENSLHYVEFKNQIKAMEENMQSLQSSISCKFKLFEENLFKSMEKQKDVLSEKVVNMGQTWSSVVSKNINKTIENNQVITSINKNLKSVKSNIDSNKDREDENKARKGKECNVCVFNIPEGTEENDEDNYKMDINKLKQVFEGKVIIKAEDLKTAYRIGMKKSDVTSPRPFILKFNNLSKRKEVLGLRNLFYKQDQEEEGNRVFVHPDRTKKEVEEHRLLVNELKQRKADGEENIGIRNGKIIKFGNPFRDRPQFSWGA